MVTKTNNNFAVIETGGKQYLVKPGDFIRIERIEKPSKEDIIHFDKILLLKEEDKINLGDPYIKGAKISGKWLEEKKGKKIIHLRYHSKTRQQTRKGHRQIYTKVAIGEF